MQPTAYEQFARLDATHWWFRGRRAVYLGLLDAAAQGAPRRRALDLGCGPGGFLAGLKLRARHVVAADFDLASLSHLPDGTPRVLLRAQSLPFAAASFDLICLFDVIEHLDDDVAALVQARRLLAPNGQIAISVPAYPWLYANNDRVAQHRRRYTRASLRAAIEAAGLVCVRNTHSNVILSPAILPFVLATRAVEALTRRRDAASASERTNLSWPLPGFAHDLLAATFRAELTFTRHFDAPFGHSIFALAQAPR